MPFDPPEGGDEREARRPAAARRIRRLAWLASVAAVLREATLIVDAIAAEGVDTESARRRLIPANDEIEALRATLGGSDDPAGEG